MLMSKDYAGELRKAITKEQWLNICRRAISDAIDGDYRARDWVTRLLLSEENKDVDKKATMKDVRSSIALIYGVSDELPNMGGSLNGNTVPISNSLGE